MTISIVSVRNFNSEHSNKNKFENPENATEIQMANDKLVHWIKKWK